jgi:hypothetical protein
VLIGAQRLVVYDGTSNDHLPRRHDARTLLRLNVQ